MAVCDWKSQTVLSITKGEAAPTMHLTAGPVIAGNYSFLSCGDKHIRIWTLSGRNLTAGKVVTSTCKAAKIQLHLCAAEAFGMYLVGCEDGSIYTVPCDGKGVKVAFEHHSAEAKSKLGKNGAAVTAMHVAHTTSGAYLFTGSKDGTVVVWDASVLKTKDVPTKLHTIDISLLDVKVSAKQIQAISMLSDPSSSSEQLVLLIATRGCDLLEVLCDPAAQTCSLYKSRGAKDKSNGIVVQAHCNDELWGVATHPSKPEYCSVGE